MSLTEPGRESPAAFVDKHRRILWALLMREISTRYGRDNIGFLWVIVEHLVFAGGVGVLWSVVRPPSDHGIKVIPFVMTGYLPVILIRQTANFAVTGVKVNNELLYHRMISPLHLFITRIGVEFIGVSCAFVFVVSLLMVVGAMAPLKEFDDLMYIYGGWFILSWMAFGFALIFGALSEIFEFVERIVQIASYVIVPISGSFYMVSWLPAWAQKYALGVPFVHCFEMIRRGFFGEFVKTYYDPLYAMAWAAGFTIVGLLLTAFVRDRVEVL
jgi:capsular polysaccharide transport system permease protein